MGLSPPESPTQRRVIIRHTFLEVVDQEKEKQRGGRVRSFTDSALETPYSYHSSDKPRRFRGDSSDDADVVVEEVPDEPVKNDDFALPRAVSPRVLSLADDIVDARVSKQASNQADPPQQYETSSTRTIDLQSAVAGPPPDLVAAQNHVRLLQSASRTTAAASTPAAQMDFTRCPAPTWGSPMHLWIAAQAVAMQGASQNVGRPAQPQQGPQAAAPVANNVHPAQPAAAPAAINAHPHPMQPAAAPAANNVHTTQSMPKASGAAWTPPPPARGRGEVSKSSGKATRAQMNQTPGAERLHVPGTKDRGRLDMGQKQSAARKALPGASRDEQFQSPTPQQEQAALLAHAASSRTDTSLPLTTVMLRNLPNRYTRTMFLEMLDKEGFAGRYDFVYLPIDFKTHNGLGYAFVDLVTQEGANILRSHFEGFSRWCYASDKVCTVSWSHPEQQGLAAHIDRYRNSPVMHSSVCEEWKPAVFWEGQHVPFPPPTRKLRAPHVRAVPQVEGDA